MEWWAETKKKVNRNEYVVLIWVKKKNSCREGSWEEIRLRAACHRTKPAHWRAHSNLACVWASGSWGALVALRYRPSTPLVHVQFWLWVLRDEQTTEHCFEYYKREILHLKERSIRWLPRFPPSWTKCDCKVIRQILLNKPAGIKLLRLLFFSHQSHGCVCVHIYIHTYCTTMKTNLNI